MFREFSFEETAFLAWFYVEISRMTGAEKFDMSVDQKIDEWRHLTGQELPSDFKQFALDVHAAQ